MNILGINPGHDAAACLIVDGVIVADAAEERFSRIKHDTGYPIQAVRYCLSAGGIKAAELDIVAIAGLYAPPRMKRYFVLTKEQLAELSALRPAESRPRQFSGQSDFPLYFERSELAPDCRFVCIEHHLAHAASAYFTRGRSDSCIIATLDGAGDGVSAAIWIGDGHKISSIRAWGQDSSLGWFYGNVTEALGWQNGDGEGTTMGLAPYGDPKKIGDRLTRFHPAFVDGELAVPHKFGQPSSLNDHGNYHWHFPKAQEIRKIADEFGRENVAARA